MTQFEYKSCILNLAPRKVRENEALLSDYGDQRWELVTVVPVPGEKKKVTLYFKRIKEVGLNE